MERMTPEDAAFLHIEDDNHHMHGCTTIGFEGPPPAQEELLRLLRAKLHFVPRFRQKVRAVPLDLARPVWVDDEHFNLEYHVRRTALPSPGGDEALRRLKARVQAQPMDRSRPLWEWWVVEGLEDDRWAIMHKTHHCIVDGVGNIDLLSVVFDTTAEPSLLAEPSRGRPSPNHRMPSSSRRRCATESPAPTSSGGRSSLPAVRRDRQWAASSTWRAERHR